MFGVSKPAKNSLDDSTRQLPPDSKATPLQNRMVVSAISVLVALRVARIISVRVWCGCDEEVEEKKVKEEAEKR